MTPEQEKQAEKLMMDYLNDEMKHYFATCKKRVIGAVTAGSNHYNPFNGMD